MLLLITEQNSDNLISFKKYFIRIAKLYIVLVNVRNYYVKYSHCGLTYISTAMQFMICRTVCYIVMKWNRRWTN